MDKEAFLTAIRDLRQQAVKRLTQDEEMGRYFRALEKLDEIEARAVEAASGSAKMVTSEAS